MAPNSSLTAARQTSPSLLDSPILPWLLAAFGLFSVYATGDLTTSLRALHFSDSDDAMRFVQVRDLVAGQGWFDMIQHRFLPPTGVLSHWSRLLDAPLAAAIAILTPLLGAPLAERATTVVWPVVLFLVYLLMLFRGMRGLFGPRTALLGVFAATQTAGLVMQFSPTRIDHHNVQIILIFGVGVCLVQAERTWRTGAIAGVLAAGSLAIGLEALPLVAIAGLIAVVDWWHKGQPAMPAFRGFGLGLAGASVALFAIQTSPRLWGGSYCDALSPPWLWLTGIGAVTTLAAAVIAPTRALARFGLAANVGLAGVAGFAVLFPACLRGPFTGMPEAVRLHWLDQVREMQPIGTIIWATPAEGLGVAATLFVAVIAAAALAVYDRAHRRIFVVTGLFLAVGAVQTCFQMRGLYVASAFVPIIAGVCLDRALPVSNAPRIGKAAKVALVLAALALNAHIWLAGGRAGEQILQKASTPKDVQTQADSCLEPAAIRPLEGLQPGVVLAAIDLGPFLLAYTHHSIAAAPYHRAFAGLIAGLAVTDGSEDELRRQAEATHARYLVVCPDKEEKAFSARLARGEVTADWLDPILLNGTALKAWRIR
ncbi:hypothetical protein MMMDOFMJ_1050 [Methylobacterium gnaphalii]|nr:hypothetical protein MMMDOFMJ_1050 [Methylobacterium gnaphalii]